MAYTCIRIEGGLLSADFLERISEMEGQKPQDFGLPPRHSLIDEISAVFRDVKLSWHAFLRRLNRSESKTTITREQWVIPLLETLGYKLTYQRRAEQIEGRTYPISHRAGEDETAPPVHIVSCEQELGEKPTLGRQISPHALLQDYLNRTEHLWGIVTNGYTLRILRDAFYFTRPSYIEFDLKQMIEGEHFDEFILFYRLVHRTRFPRSISDAKDCLLERYHQESLAQGGRIREGLRNAVEKAIKTLGNGFLSHPKNNNLRQKIKQKQLSPTSFYQQLLRLIYRLLFLMVAEERHILTDNEIYYHYYSLSRLRDLSVSLPNASLHYDDLYLGLRTLFQILRDQKFSPLLDVRPLDGKLFNPLDDLENVYLKNKDLLKAIYSLSYFVPPDENVLRRINYSALDVEELGSVYESLLDYQPVIFEKEESLSFDLNPGTERKSTGSYYTPSCLVQELIKSALEPVIEERLKNLKTKEEKETALLSLKICDPACGSGHFLLAAARRLGEELAKIRTGEEAPSPESFKEAVRDVITHCLYGVDKNPLAVDLCKVALWIEGHCKGKPLTFLDHRIKCGDSLVGIFDLNVLKEGIPDEAYKPIEVDDKQIAKQFKRQNSLQKAGQLTLYELDPQKTLTPLAEGIQKLTLIPDDDPEKIRQKEVLYKQMRENLYSQFQAANLWTTAFFIEKTKGNFHLIPTTSDIRQALEGNRLPQKIAYAEALSPKLHFFHWPLEFPEVFEKGGFDVVLGNPPWEKIKLQEKEFFSSRAPEIANAPNRTKRHKLIKKLKEENPALFKEFLEAKHEAEAVSLFLRTSKRFPFTARGDINTYSVFAELTLNLLAQNGKAGIIVPTGIATDDTNKHFFSHLMQENYMASLYDFENREKLFPAVDSRQKFSLLTIKKQATGFSQFAFFLMHPRQLKDKERLFTLSAKDISLINPNTHTTPIFRTRYDAQLTKKIYARVPVLVNEKMKGNPWDVRFLRMFDMSNDSHLFCTRKELEEKGYKLLGNIFVNGQDIYLPLYEAKMIWQFDHRFGSYEGVTSRSSTHLPTPKEEQYTDPAYVIKPWYWVSAHEVINRLEGWNKGWFIGFRDVTNTTNERTAIFSLLPKVGVNHKLPLIFVFENSIKFACLFANLNSLVLDYVVRQKMGGTSLGFFILKQLSILLPKTYTTRHLLFTIPRILELTYTAWDLKPFADDIWAEGDNSLRIAIKKQWEENQKETSGHTNTTPPDWLEIIYSLNPDNPNKNACPLPPFKWDEARRARLKAELDAFYAKLYGLTEEELRYILDPKDVFGEDYPGETFRVLKEKEIRQFGEYRTKRLILEAWRKLPTLVEIL